MSRFFLIEITQQQKIIVSVSAPTEERAKELVHDQQGEIVCILPPEIQSNQTKVVGCQSNGER